MLLAKKFFEFHARVQKCHFGTNEKLLYALGFMQEKVQKGDFL